MRMLGKPYLFFLTLLLGLSFFPLSMPSSFSTDETRNPAFEQIPLALGSWEGDDVVLDERTYEILETRNVLSRSYENAGGGRVHLLVVGSEKDRRVAHPPEVCYVSSHYDIVNARETGIEFRGEKIPLRGFFAKNKRNPRKGEEVLYVYKVGDRFTTNYYAQQLRFAWQRMTRQESQVLLIRVAGADKALFRDFLAQVLPYLS